MPVPISDLIYNSISEVRKMPNQGGLDIGWNGSYFLSETKDGKVRVQQWKEKDAKEIRQQWSN